MSRKRKKKIQDWHHVIKDNHYKRMQLKKKRKENQSKSNRYSVMLRANATKAERIIDDLLANEGIIYKFQKPFYSDDCAFIVDFYFKNIYGKKYVIEIDGPVHNTKRQREYDKRRSMFLYKRRNCCVKRFTNKEVLEDPEKVLDKILALEPCRIDGIN